MKCKRCGDTDIVDYHNQRKVETGFHCDNCGANYVLQDDSGE